MPKRANKTPYSFSNTARRCVVYSKFNERHLLSIIPQPVFDSLLNLPPEIVGKLVKNQILFIVSDGDYKPDIPVEGQEVWEVIITATKQYMTTFRTHRKRSFALTKKLLTDKYADSSKDMQELSDMTTNNSCVQHSDETYLKKPEDMPTFDVENL
jgi:hypothetical protein